VSLAERGRRIWVYCEGEGGGYRSASLELLAQARRLAAEGDAEVVEVVAITAEGDGDSETLQGRAHRVLVLTGAELVPYTADSLVAALSAAAEEDEQGLFLFPEGMRAREVLPRLAVRTGGRAVMNAVKLLAEDGELVVTRPVVGGRAYAELLVDEGPWLVAFRPNSFNPDFPADLETEVQSVETDGASSRIEVLEGAGGDVGVVDLAEAQVVVTGGRGMKDPGNLQLLEGLADALNGAVGVSRAVVDAGWAEHAIQVGKSGKTVSPTLYFAFGISGAIHHIMGMDTAKVVVAVNTDPSAPIFEYADYGIVGDALEVLPALTEAIGGNG